MFNYTHGTESQSTIILFMMHFLAPRCDQTLLQVHNCIFSRSTNTHTHTHTSSRSEPSISPPFTPALILSPHRYISNFFSIILGRQQHIQHVIPQNKIKTRTTAIEDANMNFILVHRHQSRLEYQLNINLFAIGSFDEKTTSQVRIEFRFVKSKPYGSRTMGAVKVCLFA